MVRPSHVFQEEDSIKTTHLVLSSLVSTSFMREWHQLLMIRAILVASGNFELLLAMPKLDGSFLSHPLSTMCQPHLRHQAFLNVVLRA